MIHSGVSKKMLADSGMPNFSRVVCDNSRHRADILGPEAWKAWPRATDGISGEQQSPPSDSSACPFRNSLVHSVIRYMMAKTYITMP